MAYIFPAPGVANTEMTLTIRSADLTAYTGGTPIGSGTDMVVPALQDMTVNNANDVFAWTTLDAASKFQVPTTATNSLSGNIVVSQTEFFGDGTTDGVQDIGLFGLSKTKLKVDFDLFLGTEDDGTAGKTISGEGYITGLSWTASADAPVWVSPFTITVTGDYTVA